MKNIRIIIPLSCVLLTVLGCNGDDDPNQPPPLLIDGSCNLPTPVASYNVSVVEGESLQLQTASVPDATYHWIGPNGFTSEEQNPVIPNANVAMGGHYSVKTVVGVCESEPGTVNVAVDFADIPCDIPNNTLQIENELQGYTINQVNWNLQHRAAHFDFGNNDYFNIYFPDGQGLPVAGIHTVGGTLETIRITRNYGSMMISLGPGELYLSYTAEGKMHIRFCNLPRHTGVPGYPGSGSELPAVSANLIEF